ncbi:MAG: ABC transporter ATP-binding protein/permease [Firmicutes bacterium]|nr:ABC transporter ATP-binding protein/permease [Bacillota bacterium]
MIRLEQVSKYYKSNALVAVGMRKVNLEFKIGEFVAVTGESGSGKSTLLNILSGLDTFEEGEFFLFNEPTSHFTIAQWEAYRAAYVGFVFQNYNIIESYTVLQNVLMSLEFQGYAEENRKQRALEIIDRVGLSHRVNHKASKLSGGEKQRTVIARALAKDCPAILCDEPTGNLDSKTGEEIIQLLHEISSEKLVVLVTHHFAEVEKYATRRIKMSDGEVIEDIKLLPKEIIDEAKPVEQKKIDFKTTAGIAIRNLFAAPKKFIFMLLLQVIFVFLAFMIYGTTNSLFHQNSLLPDSIEASEHQLIIQRLDQEALSDEEILMFRNNRYVKEVNEYETITSLFVSIGRTRIFTERTGVLKESDILEGRFPQNINEIMISEDLEIYLNAEIGETLTLRTVAFEPFEFIVVGISSRVSKSVYFHDDFFTNPDYVFKSIVNKVTMQLIDTFEDEERENLYRSYYVDPELEAGHVVAYINYPGMGSRSSMLKMITGYDQEKEIDITASFIFSEASMDIFMSEDLYDQMVEEFTSLDYRYRIILNVYDRYDGTRLKNSIDQDEYIVYYEALTQNQDYSSFGYVLTVGSYLMIFFVGLLMLMLLRVVFKNMVATRRKDFAIYRSIGASKRFLGRLIFLEQSLQIIIGSMLTILFGLILVLFVPTVQNSLRYIEAIDIIIVFLVFSYMTIITPIKFNQSIYEISVIETLSKSAEV